MMNSLKNNVQYKVYLPCARYLTRHGHECLPTPSHMHTSREYHCLGSKGLVWSGHSDLEYYRTLNTAHDFASKKSDICPSSNILKWRKRVDYSRHGATQLQGLSLLFFRQWWEKEEERGTDKTNLRKNQKWRNEAQSFVLVPNPPLQGGGGVDILSIQWPI